MSNFLISLHSNRRATSNATPLLLDYISMPTWAAARSTSAAMPYFEAFHWRGRLLLDGGFQVNCPAACALTEAKCIWPEKRRDTLVSLGTGKSENGEQETSHNILRLLKKV